MEIFNNIHVYADGGCKGNPGPGAIGIIICDNYDRILYEYSECIGPSTNNRAEYEAIVKGLDLAAKYTNRQVTVFSDSELVIKQITRVWRSKNDKLRELYHKVKNNERLFDRVVYQYSPRGTQRTTQADKLNKQAQAGRPVDRCHVEP